MEFYFYDSFFYDFYKNRISWNGIFSGHKVGLIGTIEVIIGEKRIHAVNTTPESYLLQEYLRQMADAGCDAVVMEASSQGYRHSSVA